MTKPSGSSAGGATKEGGEGREGGATKKGGEGREFAPWGIMLGDMLTSIIHTFRSSSLEWLPGCRARERASESERTSERAYGGLPAQHDIGTSR